MRVSLDVAAAADDFLALVGSRVRQSRARRGMPRRALAQASGISERYLAQLECGKGNASILVLKAVAEAMNVAIDELVDPRAMTPPDYLWLRERLRHADSQDIASLASLVRAGRPPRQHHHVALIGLRGAGKSTLGQALAKQLSMPFVELVQEIERTAGMVVSEILKQGGQASYRQLERDALAATLARFEHAVIAVGGSLVSEPESYELLLGSCCCVWLKATPAEHMQRVVAQGDHRPMADSRHAMSDLKRILDERSALYARADYTIDTSGHSVSESLTALTRLDAVQRLAPSDETQDSGRKE